MPPPTLNSEEPLFWLREYAGELAIAGIWLGVGVAGTIFSNYFLGG